MSCSSTGGTSLTPRAAARNVTCSASPKASRPPACASACSARPTTGPLPRRSSTACTSCAGAAGSASTRGRLLHVLRSRPRWWSTCRTGCPSAARWSPGVRSSTSCTTCTGSSGRSSSAGSAARSAGGSSRSSPRACTGLPLRHRLHRDRDGTGRAGVGADRLSVVRNGVEPTPLVSSGPRRSPRLVVLGRLVPHKQVEHAIEVLARLLPRRPDLRLSIVGEGWWEDELRAAADRWRHRRIDFLGTSTSRPSTRSWPGRGCSCARRSRRAGAWW